MKVFVSAGEVSGDIILGQVLALLRRRFPDLELSGFGGTESTRAGLRPLMPLAKTAFNGAGDVLQRVFFCGRLYRLALKALEAYRPQLVLLVDYPGLNLRLAKRARELAIPVYFIAPPQVWAYRHSVQKTERLAKFLRGAMIQTLFPFEEEAFRPFAQKVVSGHFIAEPVETRRPVSLCLCPGSRESVLRRNLPVWLHLLQGTGALPARRSTDSNRPAPVRKNRGGNSNDVSVLVPPHLEALALELALDYAVQVTTDKEATLGEARRAVAFPGTITLELALRRIPTLSAAMLDPLTWMAGKRALRKPWLALPNLLLGEDVFPEGAGPAWTWSQKRFDALWEKWLEKTWDWNSLVSRLRDVIGPAQGAEIAARECAEILEGRSTQAGPTEPG